MTELHPSDFTAFFRALHGRGPFPWQRRLAERVAAGTWPDVLDLPTASGKTACIDVAVFGLACQATRPAAERTAPRRIFFVVDRRIIVDAAHDRSLAIAGRLRLGLDAEGRPSPVLARAAAALRLVGGLDDDEDPLACVQLRGGIYRDQGWARSATQPAVIASTVDQVGSRLLFRGYGVSGSLGPVHAALAGNDALILLDEAHCALPFLQTARAVGDYRLQSSRGAPAPPPFHVAVLSATPPREGVGLPEVGDPFGLDDEDRGPEYLGPRLATSKPAELIEPINAPFRPGAARDKLAEAMGEQARRLAGTDGPRAVVVFANRVDTARAVHRELLKRARDADVVLMIGRMRPLDRDALVATWSDRLRSGADRSGLERTVYVVATQCLEVGADFDFDALVTEAASLDALRQRFGRLNRLGRPIEARAAILVRADQVKGGAKPDPIYGEALAGTWRWLNGRTDRSADAAVVDFGIDALASLLPDNAAALAELCAPATDAPVLLPAHIDCWVQTAPRPAPDPDPALFLHGSGRDRPEVQVCWRADLDEPLEGTDRPRSWIDAVSQMPPVAPECMAVPLALVRAWLAGDESAADEGGDVEHAATVEDDGRDEPAPVRRYTLRWAGPDDERTAVLGPDDRRDLRPGDTLVIPAAFEGWDAFGHIPATTETTAVDLAEQAYLAAGRRAALRLHPRLMTHTELPGSLMLQWRGPT